MTKHRKTEKKFRWANMILLCVVLFFGMRIGGKIVHYHALQNEVEEYTALLAVANANYAEKQEVVELLEDNAYVERLARERLGMVRDGEILVSVTQPTDPFQENQAQLVSLNPDREPE